MHELIGLNLKNNFCKTFYLGRVAEKTGVGVAEVVISPTAVTSEVLVASAEIAARQWVVAPPQLMTAFVIVTWHKIR